MAHRRRDKRIVLGTELPLTNTTYLADDHFIRGDVTMFAARTGIGKSQFLAHLIACCTANKEFTPGMPINPDALGRAFCSTPSASS